MIDSGYIREIVAMKYLEDGRVELHSGMKSKSGQVGDSTPRDNEWKDVNVHYDDAHINKVSGVVASYRTGGSLKDYKL